MSDTREIIASDIQNRIYTIRGTQVMIDRDLAELYQVDTKVLNQATKRNNERFPSNFKFPLTKSEKMELVTNCDRFENLKHSSSGPFAFTEQGVAMLSTVLRSDTAIKVSIQIMNAFVAMRRFLRDNAQVFHRLDSLELRQLETDKKVERVLNAIEDSSVLPKQGIFFEGQVFDAWKFASDLVRSAKSSIILIDNYIDDKDIYHIGASLKDLGKKWFAFSKIERGALEMLNRMKTT
jgi:hypothetical protein